MTPPEVYPPAVGGQASNSPQASKHLSASGRSNYEWQKRTPRTGRRGDWVTGGLPGLGDRVTGRRGNLRLGDKETW